MSIEEIKRAITSAQELKYRTVYGEIIKAHQDHNLIPML